MKNQKSLKPSAIVGQFSNSVQNIVDYFFTDGIVTTGIVIGRIFFTSNQLFGMVELLELAVSN